HGQSRKPALSAMRPLYDARIEDLGEVDFLRVDCIVCGHDEMISRVGLVVRLRLPASMPVRDLQSRFRCRKCYRAVFPDSAAADPIEVLVALLALCFDVGPPCRAMGRRRGSWKHANSPASGAGPLPPRRWGETMTLLQRCVLLAGIAAVTAASASGREIDN